MNDDYKRFCIKCSWNDPDLGCYVDPYERIYQCPMYIHYHSKEVEEWKKDYKAWLTSKERKIDKYDCKRIDRGDQKAQ